MKKFIYTSMTALFVMGSLASCNKKLKERAEELDNELKALKSQNDSLKTSVNSLNTEVTAADNQLNAITNSFAKYSPISVKTTFKDANDKEVIQNQEMKFVSELWDNYVELYSDNEGVVYISQTFGYDFEYNSRIRVRFNYNTKTNQYESSDYWFVQHDFYYETANNDFSNRYVQYGSSYSTPNVLEVKVNSLNLETGEIDYTFKVGYTGTNGDGRKPQSGKDCTTEIAYKGLLNVIKEIN